MRSCVLTCSALLLLHAQAIAAAEIVRDGNLVTSMPVQGITLTMTPREAFEHLQSLGFRAGDIESFDDWDGEGIEFVRGTFSGATGESWVSIARKEGRITRIAESWSRPRDHFKASELIDEMKQHFGITDDTSECQAPAATSGSCGVVDADDANDVDLVYGLQVLPGMLIRFAESRKAYAP